MAASFPQGYILAGGQSRRLGTDKASILWQDKPLLHHAADTLAPLTGQLFVISVHEAHDAFLPYGKLHERLEDRQPGTGPMGALHDLLQHALETTGPGWYPVLAVDFPLVPTALFSDLYQSLQQALKEPETTATSLVIPQYQDRYQPLCALWHTQLLPVLKNKLDQGQLKMMNLLNHCQFISFRPDPHCEYFRPDLFLNLNTPSDRDALQAARPKAQIKN